MEIPGSPAAVLEVQIHLPPAQSQRRTPKSAPLRRGGDDSERTCGEAVDASPDSPDDVTRDGWGALFAPAKRLGLRVARLVRGALLKAGPRVRIRLPPARSLVRTCLTLLLARTTPGAWRDPLAANAFISTSSRAVILPTLGASNQPNTERAVLFPTRTTVNRSQSASVSRNGHRTSLYLTDLAHPIGTKFEKPRFPPFAASRLRH